MAATWPAEVLVLRAPRLRQLDDAVHSNSLAMPTSQSCFVRLQASSSELKPKARQIQRWTLRVMWATLRPRIVKQFVPFWLEAEDALHFNWLACELSKTIKHFVHRTGLRHDA
jgi:hypothetical protein